MRKVFTDIMGGRWRLGMFFDVTPPPLATVNQICLLIASAGIVLIGIQLWRRRRI